MLPLPASLFPPPQVGRGQALQIVPKADRGGLDNPMAVGQHLVHKLG